MIAIIGGTGFYEFDGVSCPEQINVDTPFGEPSDGIVRSRLGEVPFLFLPRHGKGHRLMPSEINSRANIWALKSLGATKILSVSAVGSLRESLHPGDLVLSDQYFDWTRGKREGTFFGNGVVAHVSTARPVCASFADSVGVSAARLGISVHRGGTYACVEGPRLGTRAESFFLRGAGCDLVGMTNVPEVFLAREARLCYAAVGIVTDWDCWLEDPSQHADVKKVLALYGANLSRLKAIAADLIAHDILASAESPEAAVSPLPSPRCPCSASVKESLMNQFDRLDSKKKELIEFLDA